jgi:hypothetical protein
MNAPHQPQASRRPEAEIAEYNSLRAEIQAADSLNYQITFLTIGAVGAILSAASTQPIVTALFMCVLAYVVIFLSYGLLCGNRRRIWRIATYLEVFLEPELGGDGWEIRVQAQRAQAERKATDFKPTSSVIVNESLNAMAMVAVAGFAAIVFTAKARWSTDPPPPGIWVLVLLVVLIVSVALWWHVSGHERRLSRVGDVPGRYRLLWKDVKESREGGRPFNQVGPAP